MPVIEWKDDFATGIAYIDYEHRRLVELINRICADLDLADAKEAVADGLGQLYAQVSAHFALEERAMRENRYALYDLHKRDHERLLDEMRYMMEAFDAGECETCNKTLQECLRDWFHKHFKVADARLKDLHDHGRS